MKITVTLAALLGVFAATAAVAKECKVVCDAADKTLVCGSDGKTYTNKCFLEFAKCDSPALKLAHDHECPGYSAKHVHITITRAKDKKTTPKKQDEDEDNDDDDHDNDDDDNDEDDDDEDDHEKHKKCDKPCTRELHRMCASDGKTYNNKCLFEIARCKNPKLKIVDENGPCPDKCDRGCSREYEPLCASDGNTYNNKCLFEIAHCRNASLKITNADDGCQTPTTPTPHDKCDKPCSRELDQMCASDGKTYDNECLFEIAHCKNNKLTIVDRDGPCK